MSLVVSWFGDDLRCSSCRIRPKVEQKLRDGVGMPWRAGGITRASAQEVPKVDGASIYGGTPADASVIEAIRARKDLADTRIIVITAKTLTSSERRRLSGQIESLLHKGSFLDDDLLEQILSTLR